MSWISRFYNFPAHHPFLQVAARIESDCSLRFDYFFYVTFSSYFGHKLFRGVYWEYLRQNLWKLAKSLNFCVNARLCFPLLNLSLLPIYISLLQKATINYFMCAHCWRQTARDFLSLPRWTSLVVFKRAQQDEATLFQNYSLWKIKLFFNKRPLRIVFLTHLLRSHGDVLVQLKNPIWQSICERLIFIRRV